MLLQSALRRARPAGRRWIAIGSLMACVITTGVVVGDAPSNADPAAATTAAAASPLTGFTVQLGPEQRVYGPSGLTDSPYFSERSPSGKLIGFISNNDSYRTSTRSNRTIRAPKVILERGEPGSFDKCGAWLIGSVFKKTPRRWIALYHAEAAGKGDNNRCIFNDDSVVASIGRAVSRDGGKTWRKTGRVVSQNRRLDGPKTEDATMGRMIRIGDYLYLFYAASVSKRNTTRKLMVARSAVSDLGARGTWRKWHCTRSLGQRSCTWRQPGLGGRSTPIASIDTMARVILPNTYLDKYIALAATGTRGFRLWVSNTPASGLPVDPDGPLADHAWYGSMQIYPPVSRRNDRQVDTWNRTRRAKQLYAYPSIVATNGNSSTSGRTFYIYYVKLFPGDDFPERYLMRRKLVMTKADTSRLHRVALTTYFRKKDGRRRTSTELPVEKGFHARSTDGYLLSNGEIHEGWLNVFDCVRDGDHLLRTRSCATGESKYRRVGWISPDPTTDATVPIYRCFNRRKKNHFASIEPDCLGFKREVRLGYGLPPL